MSADELREQFLSFFEERRHRRVASSSLVPEGDPSLMFTNSGMVQFKNVFTGLEKRDYKRAVTAQKCLRAGGKHNDLENVGYTKRHHTFFEMLGNFSFGDYFKEEAIKYAWDFLTKELELDKSKLIATVYHEDEDAFKLWKKFLPEGKIFKKGDSDNFWQMGDSGPCGPCSEIFYDNGEREKGEVDGVEIWNLVFMQYDLQKNGDKPPLPKPCVDTGMGLERMLAVLEGKTDNYDTSLFKPLVKIICYILKLEKDAFDEGSPQRNSIKVIVDHARACAMMIGEGIVPSNEGEGYVLRRIVRRAMRHVKSIYMSELPRESKGGFASVVYGTIHCGDKIFKNLMKIEKTIHDIVCEEEQIFFAALNKGNVMLEDEISKDPSMKALKGEFAFMLYDTYGFPLDLTEDALREKGMKVDRVGFDKAMEEQRKRGRAAWVGSGESAHEALWFDLATSIKKTEFCGYEQDNIKVNIQAIIKDGKEVTSLKKGERGSLIFDKTTLYVKSGGQEGDVGFTFFNKVKESSNRGHLSFTIESVQYVHNKHFVLHHGIVKEEKIERGRSVELVLDTENRRRLEAHHSATHLLHAALRDFVGEHAQQRGSRMDAKKLTFDFNHNASLTEEQLKKIEIYINALCALAFPITWEEMSREEADKKSAVALFGEKYGEEVRVVTIGKDYSPVSVELCGGTHARTTAAIGKFQIVSESSVASGIRRIEAVAGRALAEYWEEQHSEAQAETTSLREQNKKLQTELKHSRESLLLLKSSQNSANSKNADKNSNMVRNLGNLPPKDLKPLADRILKQDKLPAIALAAEFEGKVSLLLALSPQSAQQHSAITLIEPAQKILQAKGGGKPALAQVGSSLTEKLPQAMKKLEQKLEQEFEQELGKIKPS